jgi:hypothetical protein
MADRARDTVPGAQGDGAMNDDEIQREHWRLVEERSRGVYDRAAAMRLSTAYESRFHALRMARFVNAWSDILAAVTWAAFAAEPDEVQRLVAAAREFAAGDEDMEADIADLAVWAETEAAKWKT